VGGSWKSADFMVYMYKSCGVNCQSLNERFIFPSLLSTSVCKLAYMKHKNWWDTSFFEDNSLFDLLSRKLVPDDKRVMGACAQSLTSATVLLLLIIVLSRLVSYTCIVIFLRNHVLGIVCSFCISRIRGKETFVPVIASSYLLCKALGPGIC
jgi:hypothetical protein